ncbi:MAG: transposase [Mycobacteriales bacterium]
MSVQPDWSRRSDYIHTHHAVEASWANEAVNDEHAVWLTPDPASHSGHSVRVIGYSAAAGAVLTVILVDASADPSEQPAGDWWGSNAWVANQRDLHLYGEADS